jgi:hypothetical protein
VHRSWNRRGIFRLSAKTKILKHTCFIGDINGYAVVPEEIRMSGLRLFPLTLNVALDTLFGVHSEMAILSNLCACPVECEAYSSGVMLIPPLAGLEIFLYIHPKGTYFVAPEVKIFACLDLE